MSEKTTKLTDEMLNQVSAGSEEINVKIKTLSGDNDEYKVAPSDKIQKIIKKYEQSKIL